jgi:hypothetical protein
MRPKRSRRRRRRFPIWASSANVARKLYQIITDKPDKADKPDKSDKRAPDHTGSIGGTESASAAGPEIARDTLTPDDMQIEWQGPQPPSP